MSDATVEVATFGAEAARRLPWILELQWQMPNHLDEPILENSVPGFLCSMRLVS
jgi:hypothetical protein